MYTEIKHLHSTLAYALLVGLIFTLLYTFIGYLGKKSFTDVNRKVALLGLIFAHLQLVLGFIIYFVSPLGASNMSGPGMKNAVSRLYFLEHPLTMILAIVFITIGYSKAKRAKTDRQKFTKILIFYGIGLVLVLSRIPWAVWP